MKLYLRTFGCRANQYDSEAVRAMALANGASLVDSPEQADVAVFNSCAVTADAVADLRQQVRRSARRNPSLRSVVMGCASALPSESRELRELPSVAGVVAGADVEAVAEALGIDAAASVNVARQSGARGLLRIQDGCDEHCTFCVTTLARGAHRSRPVNALVTEARALAEHHGEIVLTGVHIGSWGREIGSTLGALVEELVLEVPTVRFRLTSIEATEVDARLAELLTGAPGRVAPHLHAPLQSGSDRLLRRMGRHWYSASRYVAAVERIASRVAPFALSADVICGFPGERSEDHDATRTLVESLPFTDLHVFPYSDRPGTDASALADKVGGVAIRERGRRIRAIGEELSRRFRDAQVGTSRRALTVDDGWSAVTDNYVKVRLNQQHVRNEWTVVDL